MNSLGKSDLTRAWHLIEDLEDGVISREDREELMGLMREHASVRRMHLQHTEMVALLKESVEGRVEMNMMPCNEEMLGNQRRRSGVIALICGMAALLLLSLGFFLFQISQSPHQEARGIIMDGSHDASFTLVDAKGNPKQSTDVRVGDKLTLTRGLIQLSFPSGVEAIVEGGSQLELTSDSSLKMDGGMAWFRVPEKGHGFTVQMDSVNVIDLGTAFGIKFGGDASMQVHVAEGKVRVEPVLQGLEKIELKKNEAMEFDDLGRGKKVKPDTQAFRQNFLKSIPYVHWSFDQITDGGFSAGGTIAESQSYQAELRHLKRLPSGEDIQKSQIAGRFGGAFAMDGKGLFAESSFNGIGGHAPRTVAMWVRPRRSFNRSNTGQTPYCVWGSRSYGQIWKLTVLPTEGGLFQVGWYGGMYLVEKEAERNGDWIHLACVYTGRELANGLPEMIFYINGQRRLHHKHARYKGSYINTDISSLEAKSVRMGASLAASVSDKTVDGDLDELYIFRGALNESEIKHLMIHNELKIITGQ